jgi:tetratricopeptide (TPR) repeat protein
MGIEGPTPGRPKQLERLVLGAFLFLLLNGAYLAAFSAPTLTYYGNVLLHLVIGLLFLAGFLWIGWKSIFTRDSSGLGRIAAALAYPLMAGAGAAGIYLMLFYAIRPHLWILHLHVALAVAASVAWAVVLWGKARSGKGGSAERQFDRRAWHSAAMAGVLALALFGSVRLYVSSRPDPRDVIVNPDSPPPDMQEEAMAGAKGPFFPSSVHTTTRGKIPSNFFMQSTSQTCARSGCHPDIYAQWNSSAHHFSSFNNQWYRKSVEYMQEMVGTEPSKWCGGCHDPAVLLNGMMDTPIKEIVQRPEAQAGLGCTACHSIIQVRSTMGQGDFLVQYPPLHDLAVSSNPMLRGIHDYLIRVNPEPHRRTFLKPFHVKQPAEFCSACHKVHLDVPVNHYRWFRGFNDYDTWQASAASGQGARSFYYPKDPSTCVTCHMPLVPSTDLGNHDGLVHSHRFPAANTALPVANEDAEQLKAVTDFLTDRRLTVDLFAVATNPPSPAPASARAPAAGPELSSFFAVGEEQASAVGSGPAPGSAIGPVLAPLERLGKVARAGDSVRVDVVVRTRTVGHFFPGGTVDAFDVWTELKAVDAKGTVLLWSGFVGDDGKGPVDPSAHFYKSLMLDANGNPINKRNAWASRAILYVNLIPPSAADTVHYRLSLPKDVVSPVKLTAKVHYRKFNWWNTHWAYAGIRDPDQKNYASSPDYDDGRWVFAGDTSTVSGKLKEVPVLPVVTLATAEAELKLAGPGEALDDAPPPPIPADRERWNDYGIGLLLQGDLRGAERAFMKVTEIEPGYADGWINAARAAIVEGNLDQAQAMLDEGLKRGPDLARAHFFQGQVLKSRGLYDEALKHFRRAHDQYPRDRVILNEMGRVLFLQEKHAEAVEVLKKVMKVDPEDLMAHYNLMLAYTALGSKKEAERERELYLRFKANESAQEITGNYRQAHPFDNNERQRIHEHLSHYRAPQATPPAYPRSAGGP